MTQPSITVQYSPFQLTLEVTREGDLTAALRRVTDVPATPALVYAKEVWALGEKEVWALGEIVDTSAGPALQVGNAVFAIPKRQLSRIGSWLDGQRARLEKPPAEPARAEAPDTTAVQDDRPPVDDADPAP